MSFTLPTELCYVIGHDFTNTIQTQEEVDGVKKIIIEKIESRTCSRCGEKNPELS